MCFTGAGGALYDVGMALMGNAWHPGGEAFGQACIGVLYLADVYGWIGNQFKTVLQEAGDAFSGWAAEVVGGDAVDDVLAELVLLGGVDDAFSGVGDAAVGDFLIGKHEQVGEAYVVELVVVQGLPHGVDLGVDLVIDVFGVTGVAAVLLGDAVLVDADVTGFDF